MNSFRLPAGLLCPALAVAWLASASLAAGASGPTPENSAKMQQRIDLLLKRRLKLESLPVDPPNPFQVNMTGSITREPARDDNSPRPARIDDIATASGAASPAGPSNIDILTSIVPRLKFGGIIVQKDTTKVVINGVPRREGDMVPADWNNTVVYVKVLKLTNTDVVLRYNDADAKLSF